MDERAMTGKVVVITGASSGFGKGVALRLAPQGCVLVLAARRAELLTELAEECMLKGAASTLPVPIDVSKESEVEALARAAVAHHGRIDFWINNAGVGVIGRFDRTPLVDHLQVIATNLLGTLFGTYFAYRQFLEQRSGVVINIASELGKHTVPYYTSYAASKHGIVGLDDALRQEIDQEGNDAIHVCTVLPTAHDTPFFDHVGNYSGHAIATPHPLHDPENVVDAIVELMRNPKSQKIVGGDGVVKILAKRIAPSLAQKVAGEQMHSMQIKKAPTAEDSPGAVRAPVEHGAGVSAGRNSGKGERHASGV
jgi:short-subunit dehydrogenase